MITLPPITPSANDLDASAIGRWPLNVERTHLAFERAVAAVGGAGADRLSTCAASSPVSLYTQEPPQRYGVFYPRTHRFCQSTLALPCAARSGVRALPQLHSRSTGAPVEGRLRWRWILVVRFKCGRSALLRRNGEDEVGAGCLLRNDVEARDHEFRLWINKARLIDPHLRPRVLGGGI